MFEKKTLFQINNKGKKTRHKKREKCKINIFMDWKKGLVRNLSIRLMF
jgi:hypothetical protein